MNVQPFNDDVALCGPGAPEATQIFDLLRYCATVWHRFGNTAVTFNLKWGATALWARDKQANEIVELQAENARLAAIVAKLRPGMECSHGVPIKQYCEQCREKSA